jgi:hypothetical protein
MLDKRSGRADVHGSRAVRSERHRITLGNADCDRRVGEHLHARITDRHRRPAAAGPDGPDRHDGGYRSDRVDWRERLHRVDWQHRFDRFDWLDWQHWLHRLDRQHWIHWLEG